LLESEEDRKRRAEKEEEQGYKTKQTSIQEGLLKTQVLLVIFGILGIGVNAYLAYTSRISANIAEDSAASARRAADSTADSLEITSDDYERTIQQTIGQTVAQMKSAQAALNGVDAARTQMRLEQRAWVATIGITGIPAVNQPFITQITAKNSGRTFAKHFQMITNVQVGPAGMKLQFDKEEGQVYGSVSLLGPDGLYIGGNTVTGENSARHVPNPTQPDLDKFKSGEREAVAFGRMDYVDIFKIPHWTTFCYRLTRNLDWRSCNEYNDADNN
jgi:hypothetical protein